MVPYFYSDDGTQSAGVYSVTYDASSTTATIIINEDRHSFYETFGETQELYSREVVKAIVLLREYIDRIESLRVRTRNFSFTSPIKIVMNGVISCKMYCRRIKC